MRLHDKTTRRLAALAAVSALAVGVLAIPALADSVTEDPTEEATADGTEGPSSDALPGMRHRVRMDDAFIEALAAELDLPVDRVTQAIEAARETLAEQWEDQRLERLRERLDEEVANGDLTQEQADAIIAAAEVGVLRPDPGFRMHPRGFDHEMEREVIPAPPTWRWVPPEESGSEAAGA